MAAHYDTYDYPSYWIGREYEHESEVLALKSLLDKIRKIDTILEIGAGFGRLTPTYLYRARKIIISDPSTRLLGIARDKYRGKKNVKIVQSRAENLTEKLPGSSADLIIMVRVLHHLEDTGNFLEAARKLLKPNGYLILEFANKNHIKATLREFLKGNITFPLDIFTKDLSTKKSAKRKSLPFQNFHPDLIRHKLEEKGFEIKEGRSVSNIRSPFLKRILPCESLLSLEKFLQKPLYYINFGPSVFLLAQKKDI